MSETEKTTLRLVVYIDIKSRDLGEVLRVVFKEIQWVSLSGDKPAVCTITHVSLRLFKLTPALGRAKPTPLPPRA